jgi:hypothetical protein
MNAAEILAMALVPVVWATLGVGLWREDARWVGMSMATLIIWMLVVVVWAVG